MECPVQSLVGADGWPAPTAAAAPDGAFLLAAAGLQLAPAQAAAAAPRGGGQQLPPGEGDAPEEDRNALHKFAQDIRERGTVGAVVEAVKKNPLLLVPGGTAIMAAQAFLASGDGSAAEDGSVESGPGFNLPSYSSSSAPEPYCSGGFDLASALAPAAPAAAESPAPGMPSAAAAPAPVWQQHHPGAAAVPHEGVWQQQQQQQQPRPAPAPVETVDLLGLGD
uniref:Uncharacterized protein n=1 Tax=Alexandrium monilatum TaxID=311494 RepID=A0A7S4WBM6_9DINO|mmetsp:Transcript_11745/g.37634  ORF Transcript_11745/g.37634 Transcript_11745/m.37634 type:complete len:222 (+) Transcript_11745:64-729(+)